MTCIKKSIIVLFILLFSAVYAPVSVYAAEESIESLFSDISKQDLIEAYNRTEQIRLQKQTQTNESESESFRDRISNYILDIIDYVFDCAYENALWIILIIPISIYLLYIEIRKGGNNTNGNST